MSFSVKAVESPSPQLSPYMQPYVSPQMLPQAGQRVPTMSLSDDHLPAKRVGTDPTKYKTTICRNWEQTGMCTFRGCTFAHGVEELRAPTRMDAGSTPHLHSQYVSPGNTPPLMGTSSAAAVNHFVSSAVAAAAAGGNGNGGAQAAGPPKLEGLLELLHGEVLRERELVAVHMEANRTLESILRREQALHTETRARLDETRGEYAALVELVAQQNAVLQTLMQQRNAIASGLTSSHFGGGGVGSSVDAAGLMERATTVLRSGGDIGFERDGGAAAGREHLPPAGGSVSSTSSEEGEAKEKEKEQIEEILRALQHHS